MWASGGSRWVLLGLPFVQAHRSNLTGWFLYMRPAESGLSAVGEARQACSFGNCRRAACVGAGLGPATLRDSTGAGSGHPASTGSGGTFRGAHHRDGAPPRGSLCMLW